jgi:hypothetical protein
MAKA